MCCYYHSLATRDSYMQYSSEYHKGGSLQNVNNAMDQHTGIGI